MAPTVFALRTHLTSRTLASVGTDLVAAKALKNLASLVRPTFGMDRYDGSPRPQLSLIVFGVVFRNSDSHEGSRNSRGGGSRGGARQDGGQGTPSNCWSNGGQHPRYNTETPERSRAGAGSDARRGPFRGVAIIIIIIRQVAGGLPLVIEVP
jgi:hypothetical protein